MLRCLQRKETDPYFNIAAEEYLLLNASIDTFCLWRNEPSIIIGKHQNANREINHHLVKKSNIPVIRRITGGGTVYHDPGNINFTFIRLNRKENPVDFKFFTHPIITFLKSMGLDAKFEGKSNITINGLKVSGNSAHVFKGRVLHHGTLLFKSNLNFLNSSLETSEENYTDRSVKSVRKNVLNIADAIKAEMDIDDFMESFLSFIINFYDDAYQDPLNKDEIGAIKKLASEKYMDPDWNFGYSPEYHFSESWKDESGNYSIDLSTKEGHIESLQIKGPEKFKTFLRGIEKLLHGSLHEKNSVTQQLKKFNFASEKEKGLLNQILEHIL